MYKVHIVIEPCRSGAIGVSTPSSQCAKESIGWLTALNDTSPWWNKRLFVCEEHWKYFQKFEGYWEHGGFL